MDANSPLTATTYIIMRYTKGFAYMGKMYVWKRKELYRMPYESNSRFYGMIKCAKWGERGYYLGRYPKSFAQLLSMTTDVDVTIEYEPHKDCPF